MTAGTYVASVKSEACAPPPNPSLRARVKCSSPCCWHSSVRPTALMITKRGTTVTIFVRSNGAGAALISTPSTCSLGADSCEIGSDTRAAGAMALIDPGESEFRPASSDAQWCLRCCRARSAREMVVLVPMISSAPCLPTCSSSNAGDQAVRSAAKDDDSHAGADLGLLSQRGIVRDERLVLLKPRLPLLRSKHAVGTCEAKMFSKVSAKAYGR